MYIIIFLTPVFNSQGIKILRYAILKVQKNQAGINLTPPPPAQNNYYYYYYYFDPGTQFPGNEKDYAMQYKKVLLLLHKTVML